VPLAVSCFDVVAVVSSERGCVIAALLKPAAEPEPHEYAAVVPARCTAPGSVWSDIDIEDEHGVASERIMFAVVWKSHLLRVRDDVPHATNDAGVPAPHSGDGVAM